MRLLACSRSYRALSKCLHVTTFNTTFCTMFLLNLSFSTWYEYSPETCEKWVFGSGANLEAEVEYVHASWKSSTTYHYLPSSTW